MVPDEPSYDDYPMSSSSSSSSSATDYGPVTPYTWPVDEIRYRDARKPVVPRRVAGKRQNFTPRIRAPPRQR